jgi:hypothetical protein
MGLPILRTLLVMYKYVAKNVRISMVECVRSE